jgi:hypothetical protein
MFMGGVNRKTEATGYDRACGHATSLSNSLFVALHYYLGMAAGKSLRFAEFDVRLSEASTIEQRLAVFGEIPELGGPVPSRSCLAPWRIQPTVGTFLFPAVAPHLSYLLSHRPAVEIPEQDTRMPSNGELVKIVAPSLIKWARTGFPLWTKRSVVRIPLPPPSA